MSEHTKKHRISAHSHSTSLHISHRNKTYIIPKTIAEKYITEPKKKKKTVTPTLEEQLAKLDERYTKAGALLKGFRGRESLTQVQFAKKINVAQNNLSAMENGKRPIGKTIAKRIGKVFKINYRYFLE